MNLVNSFIKISSKIKNKHYRLTVSMREIFLGQVLLLGQVRGPSDVATTGLNFQQFSTKLVYI